MMITEIVKIPFCLTMTLLTMTRIWYRMMMRIMAKRRQELDAKSVDKRRHLKDHLFQEREKVREAVRVMYRYVLEHFIFRTVTVTLGRITFTNLRLRYSNVYAFEQCAIFELK